MRCWVHTDLCHLFPFTEKIEVEMSMILPAVPQTTCTISGDTSASPTCTWPSTWLLEAALDKYLHLCALSQATMLASIPLPDGSYYHLIILKLILFQTIYHCQGSPPRTAMLRSSIVGSRSDCKSSGMAFFKVITIPVSKIYG
jgi:hypothetical protein